MKKNEILLESYKNIQNLINLMDQKAGFILIICMASITMFYDNLKNHVITFENLEFIEIIIFIVSFLIFLLFLILLYFIIIRILLPRKTNKKALQNSLLYYKVIAESDKISFDKTFDNEKKYAEILSEDLRALSVILNKKEYFVSASLKLLMLKILLIILGLFLLNLY